MRQDRNQQAQAGRESDWSPVTILPSMSWPQRPFLSALPRIGNIAVFADAQLAYESQTGSDHVRELNPATTSNSSSSIEL